MLSERLQKVILQELDLPEWELTETTTAPEVPGWDSLSHARIISAIEVEFGVRFRTAEILRLETVGQLQALLDQKASPSRSEPT